MKSSPFQQAVAWALLALLSPLAPAQVKWEIPQPFPIGPNLNVDTRIVLRRVVGRYAPTPPPAVLRMPPGSSLQLTIPFADSEITSVVWFKNGVQLPAQTSTLRLSNVSTADSGIYVAVVQRPDVEIPFLHENFSENLLIRVEEDSAKSLLALACRSTITPASPTLIGGFTLGGSGPLQRVLIRAVGPSLKKLGVTAPLAKPSLKLFDASGAELPLDVPTELVDFDLPENARGLAWRMAPHLGALPLDQFTDDFAIVLTLPANVYTCHVSAADGGTGDVLLEIYHLPDEVLRRVLAPVDLPQSVP